VIVLDHQDVLTFIQQCPQFGGALLIKRGAARVLCPRGENHSARSAREDPLEILWAGAVVVDGDGFEEQTQGSKEVVGTDESRILHRDAVARVEVSLKSSLDAVECAAHHGDCRCGNPIGRELALCELHERRKLALLKVEAGRRIHARERISEAR
jgi:hypothetical protein